MSTTLAWPSFSATDSPMAVLIQLSRYYGANPAFVLAGGGNTSVKVGDKLYVKGSGSPLATIDESGFVEMERAALAAIVTSNFSEDVTAREEQFKQAVMAARTQPERAQRPSVECVLHELLPGQYVVHTHATLGNMVTCSQAGEALAAELFGDEVCWVPYVDPGYILAKVVAQMLSDYQARTGRACPRALLMANHGLIVAADTPEQIRENTDWVVGRIQERLDKTSAEAPFGAVQSVSDEQKRELVCTIGPALRALMAEGDALKIVSFADCPTVMSLAGGAEGREVALGGPLCPDQIVYCKSFPLWFEPVEGEAQAALVARLGEALKAHEQSTGFAPKVVLVKGLGLFAIGDTFAAAQTVREVYTDAIQVMAGAKRLGGILFMTKRNREFIDNWEVESYRRKVAASSGAAGRVAAKVAVVTGAAQGFGYEIATDLAAQGAHVVLVDINVQGAEKAAGELCARFGKGRAAGLAMNVADGASVGEGMYQVVRLFGGLDLIVANAGVLRAGSVKTLPEKDLDFVTNVNYKGYFICVQKCAPILAVQHLARPDLWFDIIQINSKSGLAGSNRNGAYAGSKFGGIGLTQSFAMELVEDGVKVNSICPGNFFDGPLWSDPNNGLFVQYLRTGKVPGAQTIEDVKRFYESKVPMGRGCTTPDVMKAIYYLVEQKYETGQAVPVTGGQVMLN